MYNSGAREEEDSEGGACEGASISGQLPTLQWLRAHSFGWDTRVTFDAARAGHMELLLWTRAQTPPAPWHNSVSSMLARRSGPGAPAWAVADGCPWDAETCHAAVRHPRRAVLAWLRAHDCPCGSMLHDDGAGLP